MSFTPFSGVRPNYTPADAESDKVVNVFVHNEIDDNTSRHVLKRNTYGGVEVDSWVLLEALM